MNILNIFKRRLNVLVLGSKGMLGSELYETLRKDSLDVDSMYGIVDGVDYPDIDISQPNALLKYFKDKIHYDYVINCAAITDTKGIQTNEAVNHKSYEVNALACQFIALACKVACAKLIHISTDYVFSECAFGILSKDDGPQPSNFSSGSYAFSNESIPYPINDYGMHKLIGELFIKNTMYSDDYTIIRVSWLYGANNNKSFVHKFLKNCYETQKNTPKQSQIVRVVTNEVSCPTNTTVLCGKIQDVMRYGLYGTYSGIDGYDNDVPTIGVSRYDFAKQILENFTNEFPDMKIEPFEASSPEFGKMRYPTYSAMEAMPFNGKNNTNWIAALNSFCYNNRDKIMAWLRNS